MKKKYLISIICVFLAFLIVPSILSLSKGQADFSEKENRALSTRPSFSFSDLMDGYFQEDYQNYLSDQFIFRDKLVSAKTNAMRLIGKKDINNVFLGKDGYLIEKYLPSDYDSKLIDKNIELLTKFLNDNKEDYDSVSCVVVPSKSNVLENKLPKNAKVYNTDYVAKAIEENLDDEVNFLYLKDILKEHNKEYIYYKSDHHWTSLGAFYGYSAYRSLVSNNAPSIDDYETVDVSKSFLGTTYDKLQMQTGADVVTRFDYKNAVDVSVDYNGERDDSDSIYVESALKEKDKYTYFLGGNYPLINISTSVDNGKKLLLIKDSFSNSVLPFLVNDYSEIVVVDLRYFDKNIYSLLYDEADITDVLVMYNTEKFMLDTNQNRLSFEQAEESEETEETGEESGDEEESGEEELGDEEESGDEEELGDEEEIGEE